MTLRRPVARTLNVCLATTMETAGTMVRLGYAYGHYGTDRAGLFDSVLEQAREYIVYCQSGRRSSAAAFLFAQRGFKVCLLEGGLWAAGRGRKVA